MTEVTAANFLDFGVFRGKQYRVHLRHRRLARCRPAERPRHLRRAGAGDHVRSRPSTRSARDVDVDGVPGAAEHAYRLEAAEGPRSPSALRARLQENAGRPIRVITVGGAETSVEVAGEIKTAWPEAEMTMICSSRCGDFKGARVETAIRRSSRGLASTMIDRETVTEVRPAEVVTDKGRCIPFDICVWSGGLRSAPDRKRRRARDRPTGPDLGRPQPAVDFPSAYHRRRRCRPSGRADRRTLPVVGVCGDHFGRLCRGCDPGAAAQAAARSVQLLHLRPGHRHRPRRRRISSYPDDKQRWFILTGRTARRVRNFFVWFITYALKLERKMPGFLFWPGRRRVSWQQANEAIQRIRTAQKVQTA